MKKITFLFTVLTISLGFGQTNLIVNGDFETGDTSSWYNTGANISASTNNPYEGTYRANMGNEACTLNQDITVQTGVEYTVDFWLRFNNAATTITYIYIKDKADDSTIASQTLDALTTTWTNVTFTFTSTTATDVYFRVQKFNRNSVTPTSINNSIGVDNVSITESTLGIDDLKQFSFSSYPNPATDYINLSAAKNIEKIEVYNLLGKQVLRENISSRTKQVNVSNLSDGIYVMKAYIEDAVGSYKFVKQ